MQKNWIGRSEGLQVRFALDKRRPPDGESELVIYTTRPDTLFGAELHGDRRRTIRWPAPPPRRTRRWRRSSPSASAPAPAQAAIETAEKLGYDTGIRAVHPFDPAWELPVYVANFVLMEYGTGAIFGCPAHDQRDLDFARKYGLPVIPGGVPPRARTRRAFEIGDIAYDGEGRMINSAFLDGMTSAEAKEAVARRLESRDARQPSRRPSARSITACATGASRASATGAARSR